MWCRVLGVQERECFTFILSIRNDPRERPPQIPGSEFRVLRGSCAVLVCLGVHLASSSLQLELCIGFETRQSTSIAKGSTGSEKSICRSRQPVPRQPALSELSLTCRCQDQRGST